jgi:hypothetical protein
MSRINSAISFWALITVTEYLLAVFRLSDVGLPDKPLDLHRPWSPFLALFFGACALPTVHNLLLAL